MMVSVHSVSGVPGPTAILSILLRASLGRIVVPDEVAVDLELAQVVVRGHAAAAAPAFVSDAQETDLVGIGMSVGGTFFGQRRGLRGGHILQPFGGFLRSAGSDVDRDVGLAADLLDEIHEFVSAESCWCRPRRPMRS